MASNELSDLFSNLLTSPPFIRWLFAAASVIIVTLLVRWLLYRFIPPLLINRSPLWEDILDRHHFLHFLYLSVPGWLVSIIAEHSRGWNNWTATLVAKSANIFSIVMVTAAILSALAAYNEFYDQRYAFSKDVPIKTVVQAVDVLVVVFSFLLIVAIILNVPLLAMAGVFAVIAGIAYYLFKVPLLGFSASLQMSMNRMLAIGDWIEMPSANANGYVEDINLTSTKVRNRDNSLVNVPTYTFIESPFQNWQTTQSGQKRRVERHMYIDQRSIAFVTAEEKAQKTAVIETLYNELQPEARQNIGMEGVRPEDLRARDAVTNLELFMAYATMVIAGHPQTHSESDVYARQEAPSPQGLPVGLYFFTRAAAFVPFYAVQREIFSHMLAVLPDFDLRPYQIISSD
ncbi:MAG: mechanosensitive ion channel family protein [Candidatus Promineifilaceae bacterium]